jgi:putative nucleotidyltransferase with HDIG domain
MRRVPEPGLSAEARADALLACLAAASDRGYLGEPVSQLEHALQAADRARRARAADALILAALFHDIGHLVAPDAPVMDGFGVVDHERIGADLLRAYGCAEALAAPVREHVAAKRYLCTHKPGYAARLSEASRATLRWQGGPMTEAEADAYAARPDLHDILAVRASDEAAKDAQAVVPGLDAYRDLLRRHLEENRLP